MEPLHRWSERFQHRPLAWLTVIALVPRLLAAFFSGGYFAQDDHFLVIEAAQSWVDGFDYNNWLPWNQPVPAHPTGHMMLYPGLHYLLFKACAALGLTDPTWKMVLVRLLHAVWSVVTVRVGYRIALRLSNRAIAWRCGLFLALLFFAPFLAVRNLIEVVSTPLLMLAAWHLLRDMDGPARRDAFVAGLFAGLALDIRFQTLFFSGGMGLALLLRREWLKGLAFGCGLVVAVAVVQGLPDLFIWGRPFVEMTEYVRYNLDNPTNTGIHLPWYDYALVLVGLFIPPFSLAVLFGYARKPRPLVLWLSVLTFLFFHSIFPNKQERFILPIVPLLFVLGYTSWELWRERSTWWARHQRLWRGVMAWTWTVNVLLLVPLCFSYSKRERVMAMLLLRDTPVDTLIIEDTVEQDPPMAPLFYLGQWGIHQEGYTDPSVDLRAAIAPSAGDGRVEVVLFVGQEHLAQRLLHMEQVLGPMELVGCAEPGLLDRTVHWLNPVNRNAVITVFRTRP
ncbi:MAG: glycosyltransferase family 39 protein [Flavobacteriales bacterium]